MTWRFFFLVSPFSWNPFFFLLTGKKCNLLAFNKASFMMLFVYFRWAWYFRLVRTSHCCQPFFSIAPIFFYPLSRPQARARICDRIGPVKVSFPLTWKNALSIDSRCVRCPLFLSQILNSKHDFFGRVPYPSFQLWTYGKIVKVEMKRIRLNRI